MNTIVIAEDHLLVREGLKLLLAMEPGLSVVAETGEGREVMPLVDKLRPNLLILDLGLPGSSGVEIATGISARCPDTRVLVLTGSLEVTTVHEALAAGADGYVLKKEDSEELVIAIRAVLAGRKYISKAVAAMFQSNSRSRAGLPPEAVTAREQQIMRLIAGGRSCQSIADQLHISPLTVRTHRQNLMEKLGLHNAAEITAYAIKHGFYEPS